MNKYFPSSKKVVSIHQPAYLPWLGYFYKIAMADEFVILDTTQYEKNSFINRNKIRTSAGPFWLTVPVETKGSFQQNLLTDTQISNQVFWQKKHWRSIEQNYGKAPFFKQYSDDLKVFYEKGYNHITTLCWEMLNFFVTRIGISTKLIRSSNLGEFKEKKTGLLVSICRQMNADIYLSGRLGKNYIQEDQFKKHAIDLIYLDYKHPEYPQLNAPFIPNLCILDLLFNMGPQSLDIIMSTS